MSPLHISVGRLDGLGCEFNPNKSPTDARGQSRLTAAAAAVLATPPSPVTYATSHNLMLLSCDAVASSRRSGDSVMRSMGQSMCSPITYKIDSNAPPHAPSTAETASRRRTGVDGLSFDISISVRPETPAPTRAYP